jgi:hypothetical protein
MSPISFFGPYPILFFSSSSSSSSIPANGKVALGVAFLPPSFFQKQDDRTAALEQKEVPLCTSNKRECFMSS